MTVRRGIGGNLSGAAAAARRAGLVAALLLAGAVPAASQQPVGDCTPAGTVANGNALLLECGAGLRITVERRSGYRIVDRDGDGRADALDLRRGAAFVEVDPAAGRRFEIRAPRAIASVRGTAWAVDVTAAVTSVLVEEGRVAVTPRGRGTGVVLAPGEGTDVRSANQNLTAIRWGAARARALLARLGR
jgi:ferric-dicitrate binding protein FerR (iron transport regulator)